MSQDQLDMNQEAKAMIGQDQLDMKQEAKAMSQDQLDHNIHTLSMILNPLPMKTRQKGLQNILPSVVNIA